MPFMIRYPEGILVKLSVLRAFVLKGFSFSHKVTKNTKEHKGETSFSIQAKKVFCMNIKYEVCNNFLCEPKAKSNFIVCLLQNLSLYSSGCVPFHQTSYFTQRCMI